MMTSDMSQYLDVFLDEGREQLALLETNILEMERGNHTSEMLQILFRAAHTLKGSSRAMGFLSIGDLTHEMENILDDLRHDLLAVSTPIVNALLDCLDALGGMVDAVAESQTDTATTDIPALVARLNVLRTAGGAAASPEVAVLDTSAPSPSSSEFPLAEHERAGAEAAAEAGLPVYHIVVTLASDCLMKSIRAWMVLGALEPLGTVLATDPSEEKLEAEEFDLSFQLLLASETELAAVEAALNSVSELASVVITPFSSTPSLPPPSQGPCSQSLDSGEHPCSQSLDSGEHPCSQSLDSGEHPCSQSLDSGEQGGVGTEGPPPPKSGGGNVPLHREAAARQDAEEKPKAEEKPSTEERLGAAAKHAAAPSQTIRVEVSRLDTLLNLVGEMVIERAQVNQLCADLHRRYPRDEEALQLLETTQRIARVTTELQDLVMRTRMLAIDGVFQRMPRMVRDLAQKTGKEVRFEMSGGETELDRTVLESLGDPLIHLLRNSVDHGVESPDARVAAGKPAEGCVTLSARHEENHIVIEITDDGAGMDPVRLKESSIRKGLITEAAAAAMSDRDALSLIFASGFSTAATLSDISGRGVGMDIVKSNLEKIGGRVHVDSAVGQGSRFTIHLPLTLAIVRAVLVESGSATYVLPLGNVLEMLRLGEGEGTTHLRSLGGQPVISLRGRTIPLANLDTLLYGPRAGMPTARIPEDAYVVVVGIGDRQVGLCVDALLGEQEVVIKSMGALLGDIAGLSGATILGDGKVALIVDVAKATERIQAPQPSKYQDQASRSRAHAAA